VRVGLPAVKSIYRLYGLWSLRALSFNEAVLILVKCRTENPPEPAAQSLPRFALQNGQTWGMGPIG